MSSAQEAFLSWRDVPVQHRARVMFKLQGLIRSDLYPRRSLFEVKYAYRGAGRPTPVKEQKCGHDVDPFLVHS